MTRSECFQVRRIEFRCNAPGASQVFLAGTFNNWDAKATPMCHQGHGQWSAVLELSPGFHHYKFVVDGRWCCEFGLSNSSPQCNTCGCTGDRCVPNLYGTTDRVKIVV